MLNSRMICDTRLPAPSLLKNHGKIIQILTLTFDLHYYMIFKQYCILYYNMLKENSRVGSRPIEKQMEKCSEGAGKTSEIKEEDGSASHLQSEDIFQPDFHTMKKLRMPIRRKLSKGSWTIEENKSYYQFLVNNRQSFSTQALRRQRRVFCQLSELLHKMRTPDQCRSHHQKLVGKQQEAIDIIIDRLRLKIRESEQERLCKRKTRIFGKFRHKKMAKQRQMKEQKIELENHSNRQQNSCEIQRVDERQFYNVITYKQSSRIQLEIQEDAIQSYILW